MNRESVRQLALQNRNLMTPLERQIKSQKIVDSLIASKQFCEADCVISYMSFRSEVNTEHLNEYVLKNGKRLFLPKAYSEKNEMKFFEVESLENLTQGYMGILEPEEKNEFKHSMDNTIMLLPGVAFDISKYRMGYGGGYYDRYLASKDINFATVMLAFECQFVDDTIPDVHDQKVDYVCTENRWI